MDSAPNYIDIALMAVMAFFTIRALVRGFIRELVGLVGVVVAVVISAMTYVSLGGMMQSVSGIKGDWWPVVAFILVLLSIFILFTYLGSMLSKLVKKGVFSNFDRFLGLGAGLIKGILVCYLLINIALLATPFQLPDMLRESVVSPYLVRAGRYLVDLVPHDLTRELQERAGFITKNKDLKNSSTQNQGAGGSQPSGGSATGTKP